MQTLMQSRTDLSYVSALRNAFANNGFRIVYSGAEARVGLLVLVNVLNELFLKKVWKPSKGGIVEVEDCDTKYCRACGTGSLLVGAPRHILSLATKAPCRTLPLDRNYRT